MNTELRKKVLLQVSISELHIYMLKIDATGVFMAYDENGLFNMSDSSLQLLLHTQSRNMT